MDTACFIRPHRGRCFLALGSLGLVAAVVLGGDAKEQRTKKPAEEQKAKRDAKEAAKMVEAIANRNKPPKILTRHTRFPSKLPLFPKGYDWKEEKCVWDALENVYQDTSADVWEALVQKVNDQGYCVTLYSGNTSDARVVTVGEICRGLAYSRLCCVFEKHLPRLPPHGRPFYLEKVWNDLLAWRKERKDKPLYELQIGVCELALRRLSERAKADAKAIEAEIAKLRRTKRPFLGEPAKGFPAVYPRREAERVREAYEKGVLEEFQSGLNK